MKLIFALLASMAPVMAAEEIVLKTGFRVQADRHEDLGATVRAYTAQGSMEFPKSSIEIIELIEPVVRSVAPAPVILPAVTPAAAPAAATPRDLLTKAAERLGLPPEFLHSVAKIESAYRPGAVSPKGAIGVMQLMPGTAAQLQVDPHVMEQNIDGGARLLRELLEKYQDRPDQVRRALSAYNAGSGAVDRYNGVPPYPETQNYVEKVLGEYSRLRTRPK